MKKALLILVALTLAVIPVFCAAQGEEQPQAKEGMSVLVYVTGVTAGSPTYELMAKGAEEFATARENVTIKIYEAGFNQAEWESQLTDLVASGEYDLVVASNPSLPDICANVAKKFPEIRFILTDAQLEGNSQIRTYLYNQYEQSLFLGYLAGLITTSNMEHANAQKVIGFIAAQEYPLLSNHMVPGFRDGAQMVDPAITVDFRVIGNWFDANKAAELATSMMAGGVDVFASISGGAAQGLFNVANEKGAYIVYHNTNEYASLPGVIVGCGIMGQKELVFQALCDAYDGKIEYGKATTVGVQDGYIDFIDTDPLYEKALPQDIRDKFNTFITDMRNGKVKYTLPSLF